MASRFDEIAVLLRERLGVSLDHYLDVVDLLLRLRISKVIRDFLIVPDGELPDVDAQWRPDEQKIAIRRSVYEGAVAGRAEDRFTIAHEVGHVVLGHPVRNRKVGGRTQFGRYIQAHEREADDFAGALLAPQSTVDLATITTPEALASEFGLPLPVATGRLNHLWHDAGASLQKPLFPRPPKHRTILIDTGNYEDAMWAMAKHAEKAQG